MASPAAATQTLHDEGKVGEAGVIGEDFAQHARRAHVDIFTGDMIQVAGAPQVLDQPLADRIRVVAVGVSEVVLRPGLGLAGELAVRSLEKRPLQVREAVHQSPSKTGFFFAANAS